MKKFILLPALILLLTQCAKETPRFQIERGKIDLITENTTVKEIDSLYANDSVVRQNIKNKFVTNRNIEIFEKGGKKLLSLSPALKGADTSKINHIQVFDNRFTTPKRAHLGSTFKAFRDQYEIKSIDRLLTSISVSFKNQDFYVTIDLNELPAELKFQRETKIESIHIPDGAKIKHLMISW